METYIRAFVKFECVRFPVQKQSVMLLVIANLYVIILIIIIKNTLVCGIISFTVY